MAALSSAVEELGDRVVAWRRHLHRHPELSFQEHETSRWIGERLSELDVPWERVEGTTSIVARLEGAGTGPMVALRADIDALPVEEEAEVPFRSQREGVMHACGHDGHTAILLGVAALLAGDPGRGGPVLLIFQSAEESPPGGARDVIAAGHLDDVDLVLGLHLTTRLPTGTAGLRPGPTMASVDRFDVRLVGEGGHAGRPHDSRDALVAAAQLVGELQTVVSRRVDPLAPAVVSVGTLHAGTAFNVIAPHAELSGTTRALDEDTRQAVRREIERVAEGVAVAHGVRPELDYLFGYPVLVNEPRATEFLRGAIAEVLGEEAVRETPPIMAGDDFAWYLGERPGAYFHLGCGNEDLAATFPNHHPRFAIDEAALPLGVEVLVRVLERVGTEKPG